MTKRVFMSRKESDKQAVARVRSILDTYAPDDVEFKASDDLPPGTEWYDWIGEQLALADLLLVFTTHPSDRWEWLLFEAGWYTRFEQEDQGPLICFHADECPPEPLNHFQCVAWRDEDAVKGFLKSFYGKPGLWGADEAINSRVAQDDVLATSITKEIIGVLDEVNARKEAVTEFHYNRYLDLAFHHQPDPTGAIPLDATVSSDRSSLNIFGLDCETRPDGSPWTWHDVVESVVAGSEREAKPQWLADLESAVTRAVAGRALDPIAGLLQSATSAKVYRPNVARVTRFCDGSTTVKVLFIHQPTRAVFPSPEAKREMLPDTARFPEEIATRPVELTT